MADHATFPVEVMTPEGSVFEGEVEMLSTRTTNGGIGILANHVPLLSILTPTELRLHGEDGEVESFAQGEGYLQVANNRALVLVEEAIKPEQLDTTVLEQRLEDAERHLAATALGSAERETAERDKRRAQVFLELARSSSE